MNPPLIPVIDLQNLAVDLARRLTLLQHFPLAASQLLTCEKSSEDEIRRHSRKVCCTSRTEKETLFIDVCTYTRLSL